MMVQQQLDVPLIWIGLTNDMDGLHWIDKSPIELFNWADDEKHSDRFNDDCVGEIFEMTFYELIRTTTL